MTPLLPFLLIPYALLWLIYIVGFRNGRFAVALWFPLTVTVLIGTLFWLFSLALLLHAFVDGGPNAAWYALGVSEMAISFFPCPILLGLSLWKRPPSEAWSIRKVLPVAGVYVALPLLVNSFSIYSDAQKLQISVKDIQGRLIEHVKANYAVTQSYIPFWLPEIARSGVAETGRGGIFTIAVPKSCALQCTLTMASYAPLTIQMSTGDERMRNVVVNWYFPAEMKGADDWKGHSGGILKKIPALEFTELTVFLPKTSADIVPDEAAAERDP